MRLIAFLGIYIVSLTCLAQEMDSVDIKKTKFALYPVAGYSPETKFSFGTIAFFVFENKNPNPTFYRPNSLTPVIIFTTNKQMLIKSELDFNFKSGVNLNLNMRLFSFPDYYFGLGYDTDPAIKTRYSDKFVQFEGRIIKPFNPKLYYGLFFDLQYNKIGDIEEGSLLDQDQPIGIDGGRNMGIGPGIQYDTRDHTLYPTKGKFIKANLTVFSKVFGSEYNYANYTLDYRQYIDVLGPKSVLAFQFKMNMASGHDMPFYKLKAIGGDNRLRGIEHKNLYRDRQSVYFQVEGRQELFWRFGGVIFAGVGQAFNTFSTFQKDQFRAVYGIGGRFRAIKGEKMNVRMDLGFTDNGQHALYISVREAF